MTMKFKPLTPSAVQDAILDSSIDLQLLAHYGICLTPLMIAPDSDMPKIEGITPDDWRMAAVALGAATRLIMERQVAQHDCAPAFGDAPPCQKCAADMMERIAQLFLMLKKGNTTNDEK